MLTKQLKRFYSKNYDPTGALKALPKFKTVMNPKSYRMAHPVYKMSDIEEIKPYHHSPKSIGDKYAALNAKVLRMGFDFITRYDPNKFMEKEWLTRALILETVAGVPPMVGAVQRHFRSLRT